MMGRETTPENGVASDNRLSGWCDRAGRDRVWSATARAIAQILRAARRRFPLPRLLRASAGANPLSEPHLSPASESEGAMAGRRHDGTGGGRTSASEGGGKGRSKGDAGGRSWPRGAPRRRWGFFGKEAAEGGGDGILAESERSGMGRASTARFSTLKKQPCLPSPTIPLRRYIDPRNRPWNPRPRRSPKN